MPREAQGCWLAHSLIIVLVAALAIVCEVLCDVPLALVFALAFALSLMGAVVDVFAPSTIWTPPSLP